MNASPHTHRPRTIKYYSNSQASEVESGLCANKINVSPFVSDLR